MIINIKVYIITNMPTDLMKAHRLLLPTSLIPTSPVVPLICSEVKTST